MDKRNKIFIAGENCKESYRVVLNNINIKEGDSVIDIGCADLSLCKILKNYTDDVTGVDIYHKEDKDILTHKRDLNKGWDLNRKYDVIISTSVIEHVENVYHFFRELKKIMHKDSIAVIYTDNINYYWSKIKFLVTNTHSGFDWKLDNMRTSESLHLNDQWHKSPLNKEEFYYKAKECGLIPIGIDYSAAQLKLFPYIHPITMKKVSNDFTSSAMCIILKRGEI